MWQIIGLILGVLILGIVGYLLARFVASQQETAERREREAERQVRDERARILAASAQAAREAEERQASFYLETLKVPEAQRVVLLKGTRIGSYLSFEARLDPSKDFLTAGTHIADLCKEGRLSSPGCASMSWGPGPEVILAGRGLSKEPLYGTRSTEERKEDNGASKVLNLLATVFASAPEQQQTEKGSSEPANGTRPPVAVTAPQCAHSGCSALAEQKRDGTYHRFCHVHAPKPPAVDGRIKVQPRPVAGVNKEEEFEA